MPPPTSTDDTQGTVIDGTARSADWREQQRAAQRPHNHRSPSTSPGASASDFDPAAAKDFVSSLMIPASKVAEQSRQTTTAPEAPDPYINTLLSGAQKRQATQSVEIDAASGAELDRWFEEQATSVPHAPAGQTLPAGSASLDSEEAGVERARRVRALRAPRAHARENEPNVPGRRVPGACAAGCGSLANGSWPGPH